MSDENLTTSNQNNNSEITDTAFEAENTFTPIAAPAAEDTAADDLEYCDTEFARELENYLPTPENTDKLKKPLPSWLSTVSISAATCIVILLIYSAVIVPRLKPAAVISYVADSGKTAAESTTDISSIAEKVSPCIATVSASIPYRNFFGLTSATNIGSGVIISSDGYILTSATLIGDGSDVTVTLSDKKDYSAKLLGADDRKDIAILKIDASDLTAVAFGNSDEVRPGDLSIVIGNVLGKELGVSVTKGIICGVNNGVTLKSGGTINLIQTDAITNNQSAGGCLLNANGDIVGMITYAVSSNAENISFAIPSNDIKNISESLINTGKAPQGLIIGITGSDNEHGVTVESVLDDTPAQKAGIKAGDLILKADGNAVRSISEINKIRDTHKKGDTIVITVYRDGETIDINVVL